MAEFLIEEIWTDEGYSQCIEVMMPILNEFLYDMNQKVRRAAVLSLVKFSELLSEQDRGDYILKFILSLSHEYEDEQARTSALEILD